MKQLKLGDIERQTEAEQLRQRNKRLKEENRRLKRNLAAVAAAARAADPSCGRATKRRQTTNGTHDVTTRQSANCGRGGASY